MIAMIDAEPGCQPTQGRTRIDAEPPTKGLDPIAAPGLTRCIMAMTTEHRPTIIEILHGSESITATATRAGPASATIKRIRWDASRHQDLPPSPPRHSTQIGHGDRMISIPLPGVVMLTHRSPLSYVRAVHSADTAAVGQP
jgi:hypothetical protein